MLKTLLPIIIGAAIGLALTQFNILNNLPFSFYNANIWFTLLAIPVSIVIGIIFHEFGHLILAYLVDIALAPLGLALLFGLKRMRKFASAFLVVFLLDNA